VKKVFLIFCITFLFGCGKAKEKRDEIFRSQAQKERKAEYMRNAALYIGSESYTLAEMEIKSALWIDPNDKNLYYALGYVYDQTGKNKKAVAAYIEGLKRDPERKDKKIGTLTPPLAFRMWSGGTETSRRKD
jgi:Tfp pilus assembly protein PilF